MICGDIIKVNWEREYIINNRYLHSTVEIYLCNIVWFSQQ